MTGYIVYLSYQNINQNPQIEEFIDNTANIYAPDGYPFSSDDCTSRLIYTSYTDESLTYEIVFRQEKFVIPDGGIDFDVYAVGNITDDVYLELVHSELDQELDSIKGTKKNQDLQSQLLDRYINENYYILSPNKSNLVFFESVRHEDFDGYSLLSIFSQLKYHTVSSRLVIKSFSNQSDSSFYGSLSVISQSSIEIVQKQTWNYDIPSIISTIGGTWTIVTTVYIFLFGIDPNSPQGIPRAIWRSFRKRKENKLDAERMRLLLEDYLVDIDDVIFHDTPDHDEDTPGEDKDIHV
ncbi:9538_t:CDS:2 [Acaulospora morrowiae]|uniref:9538_t:CDS:1 n=1 Tax=Acaulospora morrowiae TaxID=94023 RepID=A0A9N8YLQ1_9GLOM|nr:9538_t:CDS:2 [Acaulospora morrowiae]